MRAALLQLPQGHAHIQLHPDDLALVRELSANSSRMPATACRRTRGSHAGNACIDGQGAQVDATLETRWRRVLESIGHERARWQVTDEETAGDDTGPAAPLTMRPPPWGDRGAVPRGRAPTGSAAEPPAS